MEKLGTIVVTLLACATLGVGIIYMTTHDSSWTFKWQEIFKDAFRISVAILVPFVFKTWVILRDVCFIFAGWYLCDLGFEVYHIGVNEIDMPEVSEVGTYLTYCLYFTSGLIFTIFTKSETWKNITKKF